MPFEIVLARHPCRGAGAVPRPPLPRPPVEVLDGVRADDNTTVLTQHRRVEVGHVELARRVTGHDLYRDVGCALRKAWRQRHAVNDDPKTAAFGESVPAQPEAIQEGDILGWQGEVPTGFEPVLHLFLLRHEAFDARLAQIDDLVEPDLDRWPVPLLQAESVLINGHEPSALQDLSPRELGRPRYEMLFVDPVAITAGMRDRSS